MRAQIFTADIVNLQSTVTNEDGTEVVTPLIVPNVEGELVITPQSLLDLAANLKDVADPDARQIVIVSPDAALAFYDDSLTNYFDPIERVEVIEAGNIGSINGYQVVRGLQGDHPYVAAVLVHDGDDVEVLDYQASVVKL